MAQGIRKDPSYMSTCELPSLSTSLPLLLALVFYKGGGRNSRSAGGREGPGGKERRTRDTLSISSDSFYFSVALSFCRHNVATKNN